MPATNVIENAGSIYFAEDDAHVRLLLGVSGFFPHKRRIPEDVAALLWRENFLPIEAQGVATDDSGRLPERQGDEGLAEGFREPDVHLVVHEPHGNFGDSRGPFANLDSVEGVHVHEGELRNIELRLIARKEQLEDFDFQEAQLAIGDNEKVAAATGGIKEAEPGELLMEASQLSPAVLGAVELGS